MVQDVAVRVVGVGLVVRGGTRNRGARPIDGPGLGDAAGGGGVVVRAGRVECACCVDCGGPGVGETLAVVVAEAFGALIGPTGFTVVDRGDVADRIVGVAVLLEAACGAGVSFPGELLDPVPAVIRVQRGWFCCLRYGPTPASPSARNEPQPHVLRQPPDRNRLTLTPSHHPGVRG